MTTLNQAAYNILNQLRGGRSTNNEYLSLEQIKYWIKYYRALLIRRDEERLSRVEEMAQTIAVTVSGNQTWATSGQTLPGMGANTPPDVTRSVTALPSIVRMKDKPAILTVRVDDGMVEVPYIDGRRAQWNQYDRYTSGSRRCWLKDKHIYVSNWDVALTTPDIAVTAVFEDPEAAYNYNLDGADPWDDNVNEFPISADLLQQVTQSIISGEGQIIVQTLSDHTIDNLPDKSSE
jgi:hypothetical protein